MASEPTQPPDQSAIETNPITETSAPAGTPPAAPKAAASRAKVQADASGKNRALAAALIRARNDESEGRFEDALNEYEQAARLDPSDAALQRHIRLLRNRISNENELIH
jgi:hypothetical protein